MREIGSTDPPWPGVLLREFSANLDYIIEVLSHLTCEKGLQDDQLPDLIDQILALKSSPDLAEFNKMTGDLRDFCARHYSAFKEGWQEDKDHYRELYRKKVFSRKILMFHCSSSNGKQESIAEALRNDCYYDVASENLEETGIEETQHQISLVYVSDPEEISLLKIKNLHNELERVNLILFDVDRKRMMEDLQIGRSVFQLGKAGTQILYRPFPTIRLLQEFERIYTRFIADLGRQVENEEIRASKEAEMHFTLKSLEEVFMFYKIMRAKRIKLQSSGRK